MAERKTDGDAVEIEAACQYIKGATVPTCPKGGTYEFHPIGSTPTCTIPEHALQW